MAMFRLTVTECMPMSVCVYVCAFNQNNVICFTEAQRANKHTSLRARDFLVEALFLSLPLNPVCMKLPQLARKGARTHACV